MAWEAGAGYLDWRHPLVFFPGRLDVGNPLTFGDDVLRFSLAREHVRARFYSRNVSSCGPPK